MRQERNIASKPCENHRFAMAIWAVVVQLVPVVMARNRNLCYSLAGMSLIVKVSLESVSKSYIMKSVRL